MYVVNNPLGTTESIKNAYTSEEFQKQLESYYRTNQMLDECEDTVWR